MVEHRVNKSIPGTNMPPAQENSDVYQFHTPDEYRGLPNEVLPPAVVWQGFKANTTAHGIPHVDNARGPVKTVFWSIVFLACLGLLGYHSYTLFHNFFSYGVNVKVEILHKKDMTFPAVTICNANPVRQSMVGQVDAIRELVQSYSSTSNTSSTARRRKKRAAPPPAPAPPASTNTNDPQATGNSQTAAANQNDSPTAPTEADDNNPTSSTDGSDPLATGGSSAPAPSSGGSDPSATGGSSAPAPSSGGSDPSATGGSSAPSPSSGGSDPADTGGGSAPAPSTGGSDPSTTGGSSAPAPSTGGSDSSATGGGSAPAPSTGGSDPSATGGSSAPAPSSGGSDPAATGGGSAPAPSTGGSDPSATWEGSAPAPSTGGGDPSATWGDSAPAPPPGSSDPTAPSGEGNMHGGGDGGGGGGGRPHPGFQQGRQRPDGRAPRHNAEFKNKMQQILANLPAVEKIPLGHQKEDFIIDCEYSGYSCNISTDFDHFYNSVYGNCYTYNWRRNTDEAPQMSYRPGPDYGLSLIFHLEQHEYIGELAEAAGVRMVVHPQERMPFPEDEGLSITPGRLTYIGVNLLTVTRLPHPYSTCTPISNVNWTRNVFEEEYGMNYSSKACYRTCYQKWVIETCGCADPQFPSWGKSFGYRKVDACDITNDTQVMCTDNVTELYRNDNLACDCPMPCTERTFQPIISAIRWPSDPYTKELKETLADINDALSNAPNSIFEKNLAKVVVYFQEFNYQSLDYNVAYPLGEFVSGLGGILGLYIGFSVMTILEFGELLMDFLALACYKCCKRGSQKVHSGPPTPHLPPQEDYSYELPKKRPLSGNLQPPPYNYGDKNSFMVGHS